MLDKVGVQPELVRIGKFKSAGDQLLRPDMSMRHTAIAAPAIAHQQVSIRLMPHPAPMKPDSALAVGL